mgnify:CR=1 FL=1
MNTTDALHIVRLVKACCPSQAFDEYTADAWSLVLSGYSFADAKAAVAFIVAAPLELGRSRYIEPGHIIGVILKMRARRLAEAGIPDPPAGLDAGEYLQWQRETREAIASGVRRTLEVESTPADPERVRAILDEAMPGRRGRVIPLPVAEPRLTDEEIETERARQIAALEAVMPGE